MRYKGLKVDEIWKSFHLEDRGKINPTRTESHRIPTYIQKSRINPVATSFTSRTLNRSFSHSFACKVYFPGANHPLMRLDVVRKYNASITFQTNSSKFFFFLFWEKKVWKRYNKILINWFSSIRNKNLSNALRNMQITKKVDIRIIISAIVYSDLRWIVLCIRWRNGLHCTIGWYLLCIVFINKLLLSTMLTLN